MLQPGGYDLASFPEPLRVVWRVAGTSELLPGIAPGSEVWEEGLRITEGKMGGEIRIPDQK